MHRLVIFLSLLIIAFCGWTEDLPSPKDCYEDLAEESAEYHYENFCVYESKVGNLVTIDIRVLPKDNQEVFNIPYEHVRFAGAIIQIYYSSMVFGKSQWMLIPNSRVVYIHPNSISLPIDKWIEDGLTPGVFIRIVILTHESRKCPHCD